MEPLFDAEFDLSQLSIVTHSDIDDLAQYIEEQARPKAINELRLRYVKNRLIKFEPTLWSPDKKYNIGDDIVIFCSDGNSMLKRRGRVINIDFNQNSNLGLDGPNFRYNKLKVKCMDGIHFYPSDCPELKTWLENSSLERDSTEGAKIGNPYLTPSSISEKYYEIINPRLVDALHIDGRFVNFEQEWSLHKIANRIFIPGETIQNICYYLLQNRRPIPIDEITSKFGNEYNQDLPNFKFVLCLRLKEEKLFLHYYENGISYWTIAPPPSRAENKLDYDSIRNGVLKLTLGLRKILANIGVYQSNQIINLRVKGNYPIKAVYDGNNSIQSGQILDWMEESNLAIGDKVFIKINEDGESLRLYSQYEVTPREEPPWIQLHDEERRDIPLRDKIFLVLKEIGQYLHYRKIHELVRKRFDGVEELNSIAATLSLNKHLFQQEYKMLWGLSEWSTSQNPVDKTSIIFAVREDDLIFTILNNHGEPMEYGEICRQISQYFGLPLEYVKDADILDPNDTRIIRLLNGTFALVSWKDSLLEDLEAIKKRMEDIKRITAEIWDFEKLMHDITTEINQIELQKDNLKVEQNILLENNKLLDKENQCLILRIPIAPFNFLYFLLPLVLIGITLLIYLYFQTNIPMLILIVIGLIILITFFLFINTWHKKYKIDRQAIEKLKIIEQETNAIKEKIINNQNVIYDIENKIDKLFEQRKSIESDIEKLNTNMKDVSINDLDIEVKLFEDKIKLFP